MNLGSEPEFCLTVGVRNVDMNAWLFPGEEKKAELTIANNCGCHARTLHRGLCRISSPVPWDFPRLALSWQRLQKAPDVRKVHGLPGRQCGRGVVRPLDV